jgi:(p)ppGpp synthase/HD superfamily hydrolase
MLVIVEISHREFAQSNLSGISRKDSVRLWLAWLLAALVHFGQKLRSRKPYILHPMGVTHLLKSESIELQIAGLLHDAFEDAPAWLLKPTMRLVRLFGLEVYDMVFAVTNWWNEDAKYFAQMSEAIKKRPKTLILKCADRLHVISTPYNRPKNKEISYLKKTQDGFCYFAMEHCKYLVGEDQIFCKAILAEITNRTESRLRELNKK